MSDSSKLQSLDYHKPESTLGPPVPLVIVARVTVVAIAAIAALAIVCFVFVVLRGDSTL